MAGCNGETKPKEYLNYILKEIGWTSGHHVPVADEANRELEREVERLLLARADFATRIDKLKARRNELEKHMQHINHEANESDALLATQKNQLATEVEHTKTVKRELLKLNDEIKSFGKESNNTHDRYSRFQNEICRTLSRLEGLKKTVSYDKEALELWEHALAKTQEDNSVIKKFSQKDQQRAQELELRRQKLMGELENRKELSRKMIAELMELETNLDKSCNLYAEAKNQRAVLLKQWREAVAHLRQRHEDMHLINLEIEKLKETVAKKLEDIEEQNNFYTNELNNNKEYHRQIAAISHSISRVQEENLHLKVKVQDFHSEVCISKRELSTEANNLENARIHSKKLLVDIEEKRVTIQKMINSNSELQSKLNFVQSKSMSASERAKEVNTMVESAKTLSNKLSTEIGRLQGIVYRSTQHLKELQEVENSYAIEFRNIQISSEVLDKNEKKLNNKLQQQKEAIYAVDFLIAQLEYKLDQFQGKTLDDLDEEKQNKIQNLESILKEKLDVINLLSKQVVRIQDDIRRLGTQLSSDNNTLLRLQDSLENESKMVEGGKRAVKASLLRSQEKQVEENILRLRVTQAQKVLENIDNKLYTLEKHRLEMEMAMKERQIEISVERDVLALRKRSLTEEKSKIRGEIQERIIRIEQYKKRFELAISLLGLDEDGNPITPAYFKIKIAQEKQYLQDEGDQWDAKVRKAEQEIVAMENTLNVVNLTNNKFRNCLDTIEDTAPEEAHLKQLENELYEWLKKVRIVREKRSDYKKRLEEQENVYEEMQNKIDGESEKNRQYETDFRAMQKSIADQADRLLRANRTLAKVLKTVRSGVRNLVFEKEIKARELSSLNQNAMQQLIDLLLRHIEVQPTITRLCDYYHVSLPSLDKFYPRPKSLSSVSSLGSVGMDDDKVSTSSTSSAAPKYVYLCDQILGDIPKTVKTITLDLPENNMFSSH